MIFNQQQPHDESTNQVLCFGLSSDGKEGGSDGKEGSSDGREGCFLPSASSNSSIEFLF